MIRAILIPKINKWRRSIDKKDGVFQIKKCGMLLLAGILATGLLMGCSNNTPDDVPVSYDEEKEEVSDKVEPIPTETVNKKVVEVVYPYEQELNIIKDNYRTYYEVFLYSFYDSNGDGIGDIQGLINQLDYINDGDSNTHDDLGLNGIWLMPIMPSHTYHKYDVLDYYEIDKVYGTLEDFKQLIEECKKRDIHLIIDLVLNHSSSAHPWFLSAKKSISIEPCGKEICVHEELCREHNPYVGYYNFAQGKSYAKGYYPVGYEDWYYEGVFWSEMPDLNLDSKELRSEIENIMKYWLDLGVSGFRLDAPLHYYNEDTDRNIEGLRWINDYVKSIKPDAYIVGEVWANFTRYTKYVSSGIDSVFNFAFATESGIIAKKLNSPLSKVTGKEFTEAMLQVQKSLEENNPNAMDASFFTNHDTARGEGFFAENTHKIKMAQGLNLFMGGSTFVYYGEELGMSGSGRDENKRAPMYWSAEQIEGMTDGPASMETIIHKYGSLVEQKEDPLSIYHYVKRAIRIRNENPELSRGKITEIIGFDDNRVSMIKKEYDNSTIYVLYNFSEEAMKLDMSTKLPQNVSIRGYLSTDGIVITLEEGELSIPAYSIVVFK